MKRLKSYLSSLLMLVAAPFFFTACSSEEMEGQEPEGTHTCRLVWDGEIGNYGNGTRALREKQNGDCVLLRFRSGNNYVNGKAVYDLSANEWILTYNGSLTQGETSSCQAYFFEDEVEGNSISLHQGIVVRRDINAQYTKEENCVRLSAKLYPATGRIRFKGEAGRSFLFSGISYYTAFNTETFELTAAQTPLEMAVGNDGFTPYVHAIPLAERTLTIYYDFQTYKTSCESPILDAGRSGYMLLPTENAHNGWDLVKVELPTLSGVKIDALSDVTAQVNASVTSLGNGTLLDAGFVYAETENPTLESSKVSCGPITTLAATLQDMEPETEYYVRAYATNERGTNYGAELKIRTTATPTIPNVHTGDVSNIQSNRADAQGTIVELGEVSEITQHGHVWSTTPNPNLENSKTELGSTTKTGEYTSILTGLLPNTKYYVRAYAINRVGISYGEQQTFTTPYGSVVMKTTTTEIKFNNATIQTTISDLGGHHVAERGICWGTTATLSDKDNKIVSSSTENVFTTKITNLTEKTTYYVCSYVKIENDEIVYSDVLKFTTVPKDLSFTEDDYNEDENWSDQKPDGDIEINEGEYGGDEDWSTQKPDKDGNDINKEDYDNDEDWSNEKPDPENVEINKGTYEKDENWNKK